MKSIWFLSAFIAVVSCTELPIVDEVIQEVLDQVSDLSGITLLDDNPVVVLKTEVKFFHLDRATRNDPPTQIYIDDTYLALALQSKPIVFIVHGWIESMQKPWVTKLAKAWLDAVDCNIIIVDYEKLASYLYNIAAIRYAPRVGEYLCEFMEVLEIGGITGSSMTIVGHSLGGQVAGYAGACFGNLGTIYALDAAGPLFTTPLPVTLNKRLDKSDANWVQGIHTSALLGSLKEIGHSDYYVDGGTEIQCGCFPLFLAADVTNTQEPLCSHQMSITYMIHSLKEEIKCKGVKGCSNLVNLIKSKVCAFDSLLSGLLFNPYKPTLLQILQYGVCEYDIFGIHSARKLGQFFVPTKLEVPHCFG